MTPQEQQQLESITNNTPSRKWLRMAFVAWPVVSIVFNMIPFLRKFILNKILGKIENADVKVERLHLSLLKHSCMVRGFEYRNIGFNEDESLDCSVEAAELSFDWKALWRGVLICEMAANGIYFHITRHKKTDDKSGYSTLLAQGFQTDVPLIMKNLEIRNSRIGFTDATGAEDVHFEADDVRLTVSRLSNVALNEEPLPTAISLRANIYEGFVTVRAKANLLGTQPAFDVDTELVAVNMAQLNDFFRRYGKFDVHGGTLGFFSEVAASDGKYKGYVKPIVRNLEVVGPAEQHETVLQRMWERTVAVSATMLKNQRKDQLGTKVPFEGKFEPRINVWHAIFETLINAFVQALRPSIDYEINVYSVEEK